MNVKRNTDYSELYQGIDTALAASLPQMGLYWELGRLVAAQMEKGATVAAAAYLQSQQPGEKGFSARSVRRMREFYLAYESRPEIADEAMKIGWTQNIVILEADLTLDERAWYIRAVSRFSWSKLALMEKIKKRAHEQVDLDTETELCYPKTVERVEEANDENPLCVSREYLPQSDGRIRDEGHGGKSGPVEGHPRRVRSDDRRGDRQPRLSSGAEKLAEHGIGCEGKTARQMRYPDYERYDLIIGMDQENLYDMRRICLGDPEGKIHLLMDYTDRPGDVADPWYTRDFEATWHDVEEGCRGLLEYLSQKRD